MRKYRRFAAFKRAGLELPFPWTREFPGKRIAADDEGRARWNLNGSILVHNPRHPLASKKHGTVHEHRMIVYDAGISDLPQGVEVHHRNGDRTDNRLENLEVMTRADHHLLHGEWRRADNAARRSQTA